MNILLWIAQIILAGMFLMAGSMKTFMYEQMVASSPLTATLPHGLVTFIGIAEILGAVGLILPMLLRIKPWLTPLAAAMLAVVMVPATVIHLVRDESIAITMTLFALGVFVAYGRWRMLPATESRVQTAASQPS